jgi:hypothetical protein
MRHVMLVTIYFSFLDIEQDRSCVKTTSKHGLRWTKTQTGTGMSWAKTWLSRPQFALEQPKAGIMPAFFTYPAATLPAEGTCKT